MKIVIPKRENPNLSVDDVEKIMMEIESRVKRAGIELSYYIENRAKTIVVNLNARLYFPVYNTYPYTSSENYYIEFDERGKPIAVNKWFGNIVMRIRRGRYLQFCHWAILDNVINETLDKYGVYANVRSHWGRIREGRKWVRIEPNNPQHEGNLYKLHRCVEV